VTAKSQQLQIRVTPRQKAQLKRRASAAGTDVSSYVLARALPPEGDRFADILRTIVRDESPRFALAELNDFLSACSPSSFLDAVTSADLSRLTPYMQNYVTAMVEQAAHLKGMSPPTWTREVEPRDSPHFATMLTSLRPHLLRSAPVAFKRRNIFVDASIGDRV